MRTQHDHWHALFRTGSFTQLIVWLPLYRKINATTCRDNNTIHSKLESIRKQHGRNTFPYCSRRQRCFYLSNALCQICPQELQISDRRQTHSHGRAGRACAGETCRSHWCCPEVQQLSAVWQPATYCTALRLIPKLDTAEHAKLSNTCYTAQQKGCLRSQVG